jgi:hypothetical protein
MSVESSNVISWRLLSKCQFTAKTWCRFWDRTGKSRWTRPQKTQVPPYAESKLPIAEAFRGRTAILPPINGAEAWAPRGHAVCTISKKKTRPCVSPIKSKISQVGFFAECGKNPVGLVRLATMRHWSGQSGWGVLTAEMCKSSDLWRPHETQKLVC